MNLALLGAGAHVPSSFPSDWTPAALSNLLLWVDLSDAATRWQVSDGTVPAAADGNPLGRIADKGAANHHYIMATAGARPTYETDGSKHWAEGNGVGQYMRSLFSLPQPYDVVCSIRQISWTLNRAILGGGNANAGNLFQSNGTPSLRASGGSTSANNVGLPEGADGVVRIRFNGASSIFDVNGTVLSGINLGTTDPGGSTLFGFYNNVNFANARMYAQVIGGPWTDDEIAKLKIYMARKAGLL